MTGEAIGRVVGTLFVHFVVMLIVGGGYYLVRRPRVTFWGAVFRWWVVLIGALVLLLGLLGQAINEVASALLPARGSGQHVAHRVQAGLCRCDERGGP